jgi:amino-acid N-acetyltransferase
MTIKQASDYKEEVIALLTAEGLPVADLPDRLDNFFVAVKDTEVVGVIGMEVYGSYGLLRSLAVGQQHRNAGIAKKLTGQIEALSRAKGLTALYLLTETAPAYFKHNGFIKVERGNVPPQVQASSEFSHVCPVSAIVMQKNIHTPT